MYKRCWLVVQTMADITYLHLTLTCARASLLFSGSFAASLCLWTFQRYDAILIVASARHTPYLTEFPGSCSNLARLSPYETCRKALHRRCCRDPKGLQLSSQEPSTACHPASVPKTMLAALMIPIGPQVRRWCSSGPPLAGESFRNFKGL